MTHPIEGVLPAMLTPMRPDESPDLEAIPALVDYVLAGGVHGLFVVGTHGEAYALDAGEREAVISAYVQAADRAGTQGRRPPVIAGVGGITTRASIGNLRAAERAGADAVSVVAPSFISITQEELYRHFRAVAEATQLPVALYNLPRATHLSIEPPTLARLAEVDNIVAVKDSSGDLNNTIDYIRLTPDDFAVMNGNDALIFAALAVGAAGAVAATANIAPGLAVRIYQAYRDGDMAAARAAQMALIPLRRCFSLGTVPAPMKRAAELLGLPVGPTAAPVSPLAPDADEALAQVLTELGLLAR
ncbi:MAG TPA: 4-hydroxy-tetrahydrodipicolinate synthase [Armatimonadetes bacterium]|nr:4-hydroxy-tetrahydrodipicolinate synthase [Armatimonadota bacterium]